MHPAGPSSASCARWWAATLVGARRCPVATAHAAGPRTAVVLDGKRLASSSSRSPDGSSLSTDALPTPAVSRSSDGDGDRPAPAPAAPTPVHPDDAAAVDPPVSGSAHLFALAAEEEQAAARSGADPTRTPPALLRELEDAPWTGDEPLEATVLRMLVDKHKPQRTGKITSADDRIREEVQRSALGRMMDEGRGMGPRGTGGARVDGGGGTDDVVRPRTTRGIERKTKVFPGHLVGGDPDHQPWMSQYATPTASEAPLVRRGLLLATKQSASGKPRSPVPADAAARAALRRERALAAGPGRAVDARGKVLDFQLGKIAARVAQGRRTADGPTAAAFDEIDEDLDVRVVMTPADYRIERARLDGEFDNLPGRGKPLDSNAGSLTFVGRSEFFMNKVMQKQDVLPVWIDLRKQHTHALDGLRTALAAMLHRRLLIHPALPRYASLAQIERLRVKEVELGGDERAFWEGMVRDVNNKARSADGVAPPSTRKGTTSLALELELAYPQAARMVHSTLHAPPPPPPVLNQVDVSQIEWGMNWSWLSRFALWRWWTRLRARFGSPGS